MSWPHVTITEQPDDAMCTNNYREGWGTGFYFLCHFHFIF